MEIFYTPSAEKFIRQLLKSNPSAACKIGALIEKLANNEELPQIEIIKTHQKGEFMRIRIGIYRVICFTAKDSLTIYLIGTRQSVYKIFNRQK